MSQFSLLQQKMLQTAAAKAASVALQKEALTAKNKEAAKEHLLRMQVMLARMSTK